VGSAFLNIGGGWYRLGLTTPPNVSYLQHFEKEVNYGTDCN